MQTVSNHPVHIQNKIGEFSTSSFIPFCAFGEHLIGPYINGLNIPLCNIFKTKNHNDHLCYETDLQELKNNSTESLLKQLEFGLTLILDYNEERQIDFNHRPVKKYRVKKFVSGNAQSVSLYLNAIGRHGKHLLFVLFVPYTVNEFYSDPVKLVGEGQYNLLSMKETSVTDSFLGLDKDIKNCQTIESVDDCKTRLYIEKIRNKCRCLPLSINLSDKVEFKNFQTI